MSASELCPVCDSALSFFDRGQVLGKYSVDYQRCGCCGLVALTSPHWLDEAYASAISDADTGLLRRSRQLSILTSAIIRAEGLARGRFLDWAGGYGTLTRLMRDRGYAFWHHDDYAPGIFAQGFLDDGTTAYDLVTAYEVVEHLADPRNELKKLSERSDRLLFSTLLLPDPTPAVSEWWYYAPAVGQHITFHTLKSLGALGEQLGYELTSNGHDLHMFHRVSLRSPTRLLLSPRLSEARQWGREILTRPRRARAAQARQSAERGDDSSV